MDGDKEITFDEFRTWFLRILEFREVCYADEIKKNSVSDNSKCARESHCSCMHGLQMWRRCAEVRGEHPLEVDTGGEGDTDIIQIEKSANGRLVAGQGTSFARDVAVTQKQINVSCTWLSFIANDTFCF